MKSKKNKLTAEEEIIKKELAKENRRKREEEKAAQEKRINDFRKEHSAILAGITNKLFLPKDTQYIIHCGKTNSGKTYNAIEALKKNGSGVYLAPLRLLAFEIQDKLCNSGYKCSLITGEEKIIVDDSNYIASTIEMLDYSKYYDTIIIDEAFMISDSDRGKSWTRAILDCNAREVHIIVNEEGLEVIENMLTLTHRKYEVKKYNMLQKFKFSDTPTQMSRKLVKGTVFVVFSRINVLINKLKLENLGHDVSILYGNLPPEVKKSQIDKFISGESTMMVTTDVIGMGINLPANSIIFLETDKFDGVCSRKLTSTEIKQIAGRTGRYGISNDNSFVSATNKQDLNYIKTNYNNFVNVPHAYIGLDYDIFSSFDESMSVIDRIENFRMIDFIPKSLKKILLKESTSKYMGIAQEIDKKSFTLNVKWVFLTAPIKNNNKSYFSAFVLNYEKYNKIIPPGFINYNDIKLLEDNISEIDLYLNLSRSLNHDTTENEKYVNKKYELIEKLNNVLLDKKLCTTKTCGLCSTRIPITHPYKYCETCYENKIRSNYNDDYFIWR